MKIEERQEHGVTVIDAIGDMHGGPENMRLLDRIEELGRDGQLDVVVNLKRVRFIASNGLGILVRTRSRYARYGGMLRFCNPNPRILNLLTITRLNLLFDVYETCEEALAAVEAQEVR